MSVGTRVLPKVSVYDVYEKPFSLYTPDGTQEDRREAMERSTHLQQTPASRMFFAQANVDTLQKRLQQEIQKRTGMRIDRQSDEQLLIVMRYVFIQSGSNMGSANEVARLNELVLAEIVPQVGAGLMQYIDYLRDASTLPTPIPRGQATSIKGLKITELFKGL